jgi:hypothetical protein
VEITDTLDFLLGRWEIVRFLSDYANERAAVFRGTLEVSSHTGAGEEAIYREAGLLRLGAQFSEAQRSLACRRAHRGAVTTFLPSGDPFIELDLTSGRCEAEHLCGGDRYRLSYHVLGPSRIEERWQVIGPAKGYEASATLTRLPPFKNRTLASTSEHAR